VQCTDVCALSTKKTEAGIAIPTRAGFKCVEAVGRIIIVQQEGHPACKKQTGEVLVWLSVWSKGADNSMQTL